jgi:hypothetical protein
VHVAGRADGSQALTLTGKLATVGAINAEDVTTGHLAKAMR